MAMPGWALALGALNETPKVAGNWVNLFKSVQDLRDQSNTGDALRQLDQFKTSQESDAYQPQGYISPESYQTLRKLRAERTQALLAKEAAGPLGKIDALRGDPAYQTPETMAEINKNPTQAVFGHDVPDNPYVSEALQSFRTGIQNRLNRFSATQGDRWAGAALDDKQANAFKDVATGQKDYAKLDSDAKEAIAKEGLNTVIANYPLERNVQSWNGLVQKLRRIPGIEPALVDSTLKDIASRNQAPVGGPLAQFIKNGPNSTKSEVSVDMFGEPIASTRVSSVNNPSDRELGLTPVKGGAGTGSSGQIATVSYPGPDGETVEQQIHMGDPLNNELVAGVVERAKRNEPGYHVTMPHRSKNGDVTFKTYGNRPSGKEKRSFGLGARPGGGAAPSGGGGGFTYRDGKLVAN